MTCRFPLRAERTRRVAVAVAAAAVSVATAWLWWTCRVVETATVRQLSLDNYDAYAYYLPTFDYAFRELRAGRFPFWNPYQLCGEPFFATAQHLLLYPLNLCFLVLPTAAALQATTVLHLVLGLLCAALLGRVFGLVWPAAAVVAAAFVFSPAITCLVAVPHHLYGAVWMPLHLALAHLLLTRPRKLRWATLLGVSLATQYLGGYPMFCLFSAYMLIGYGMWWSIWSWWTAGGPALIARGAVALAGAGGLALLLSGPQLLPALELSELSVRGLNGLDIEAADPAFGSTSLQTIVLQTLLPAPSHPLRFLPTSPAPGWVMLALIGAAAFNGRQRRAAGFFALFAIITFLLGLGRHAPLYELYFHLPGSNMFRVAGRFFSLTALPLAMLAGIGADGLWRITGRPRAALVALALLIALALALLVVLHVASDSIALSGILRPNWTEPGLLRRLRVGSIELGGIAIWLGLFLATVGPLRAVLVAAVPFAVVASLFVSHYQRLILPELDPDLLQMPEPVVQFTRGHQHFSRTHVPLVGFNPKGTPLLPTKSGLRYGLYEDMDRENTYARRYAEYTERLLPPDLAAFRAAWLAAAGLSVPQGDYLLVPESPNLGLLNLMGTRFIVEGPSAKFLGATPSERFPLRYAHAGVRVLENPDALPRAFTVRRAEVVDADAVLDRLTDPAFDPRTTVILEQRPDVPLDGGEPAGTTRIVTYESGRVVIETKTPTPALLVLTDQHYPGWRALVDEEPAPILRADYLFRAVAVPSGSHLVEFRFVPESFYRGLALAGLGILLLGGALVVTSRRRRRPVGGGATPGPRPTSPETPGATSSP